MRRDENFENTVLKLVVSALLIVGDIFLVRFGLKHLGGDLLAGFGVSLLMLGSIVFCAVVLSIFWTPQISGLLSNPLAGLFDGGNEPPDLKPGYSMAISKRKQGKPLEAVVEVRKQLARFPHDIEGVLLLAAIQAEDLKDLPSAETTLDHFCAWPAAPPGQVAAAWNQLADWQLRRGRDADAARATLEKIFARYPDSELAQQAAQRIAHLAGAEKMLADASDRQPMPIPEGIENVGLLESSARLQPAEADPKKLAAEYVKHLEQHPQDAEVREQLAILYADQYQRLDLAAGELGQLIDAPNQPPKQVAHWLNLLADLQVRHGADPATVRQTLQQIIDRFPDWAAADLARTRLNRLPLEFKAQGQRQAIKLGTYEQNIGLKRGRPGKP